MTAALYLARYRRRILLVDAGDSRAKLAPQSHNYPGAVEGVSGLTLLSALEQQLSAYPVMRRQGLAAALRRDGEGFALEIDAECVSARHVLLATGIRDHRPVFEPHDEAVIDGLLRYCPICDGYEGRGQKLCVLGPAQAAAAKGRFLRTYTASVTVAATDGLDQLGPELAAEMEALGIAVREAIPHAPLVRQGRTMLVPYRDGGMESFDAVYPALGALPGSALAGALGAEVDPSGCLVVDDHYSTTVPGLYAAGDVVSDVHQIAAAIGHAAVAATAIHNSLPLAPVEEPPL